MAWSGAAACQATGRAGKLNELLIASRNAHKVHELAQILMGVPVVLRSLADQGISEEVEETGATYSENATLKATTYARLSGMLSLADDSGLEVDYLGGEPGLRSARYAGEGASNQDRIAKLLRNLQGVRWERRAARFVCVIAVAGPGGPPVLFRGTCDGIIALAPTGEGGFGYDPVFYMPEFGCTLAELPEEVKNRVSHRARAALAAAPYLGALSLRS
jgi:XTP/dITP diphosphohydrolase